MMATRADAIDRVREHFHSGEFLRELDKASPEEAVDHLARAAHGFSRGSLPDDLCVVAVRARFKQRWYGAPSGAEPVAAEPEAVPRGPA